MPLHSLIHSPAELSRSLTHPTGHSFFDTQHREATKRSSDQAKASLSIRPSSAEAQDRLKSPSRGVWWRVQQIFFGKVFRWLAHTPTKGPILSLSGRCDPTEFMRLLFKLTLWLLHRKVNGGQIIRDCWR